MAGSVKLTREQLFNKLWELGHSKTAEFYSVSLNEIIDVCEKNNIPMPDRDFYKSKVKKTPINIPTLPPSNNEFVELKCVYKRKKHQDSSYGNRANAICILQILEDYTDINTQISVAQIIKHMEEDYRQTVDRKTVGKTIDLLVDLGYEIVNLGEGRYEKNLYYLDEKTLEPLEAKLIMDSLLLNPLISHKEMDEIANKINSHLVKRTPLQRTWRWRCLDENVEKYEHPYNLYDILDIIDIALMNDKKISFNYLTYDTNKKPIEQGSYLVTPQMIKQENGNYYLFCELDDNKYLEFRLDKIRNAMVSDEPSSGKRIAGKAPVVGEYKYDSIWYGQIKVICDNNILEKIVEYFDHSMDYVDFKDNGDNKTFTLTTSSYPNTLVDFLAASADQCEIAEPEIIRNMVIDKIKNNKYGV